MVSIRDSLSELDKLHALQSSAVENYMAVLRDVEQYAVEIDEEITPAFQQHLAALAAGLKQRSAVEDLVASRSLVRNELRDYRDRAAVVLNNLRRDLSEKLEALGVIVEAMACADGDHEERMNKAITSLRKLAATPAATSVRTALIEAAGQIQASVEEVKRQNSLTIGQFMVEIKTLHKRIETLETAGRKDVLTGLFSRVEMEGRISAEIDGRNGFSLLLLRICNLPMVQRQFGAGIRADVTAAFTKRMHGSLPDNAIVGRWSEEQFLVLLPVNKVQAMDLAKKLTEHIAGMYVCMDNGKPQRPSLQVNVAVIEHQPGGPYESLIARINQL
jgi:GGDEF domain-containing protein